jgi:BirA family biotin operon repressor/biotin-[acetyl-CoA-carboxylase] ligase
MDSRLDISLESNLSSQAIRQGLETRWLGRQEVYCFDVVDSTNLEAKRLALKGAPEGTVVVAEGQSQGRGRLNRHWVSPRGKGLYLSVILRPQLPPEWGSRIALTAGAALAVAIGEIGLRPELKWPNDIMIGHRKAAGILTEASLDAKGMGSVIVGVGINVNTGEEDFPVSIRNLATSLCLSAGQAVSRVRLLQGFLRQLEIWYELLRQGSFERILEAWRHYESILGRLVEVCVGGTKLLGVAEDIDSDGKLLVRDNAGHLHQIMVGDVVHCRLHGKKGSGFST